MEKIKGSDKPWLKNYRLGPYPLKKTLAPYPQAPMYKFLDDSASAYPGQTAVEYLGRRIKYSQLKDHVDRLANAFASLGVEKGDRVAAILPNCPQYIITDFAVSKAGGVLVPCSTLHKIGDLEHELRESGARMVVCTDEALSLVQGIQDRTKVKEIIVTAPLEYSSMAPEMQRTPGVRQFKDLLSTFDPSPPRVDIDPVRDLAYLSFTGGSTGTPKGVMITHYNRACNVRQGMWLLEPLWPGIKGKAAVEMLIPLFHSYGHLGMEVSIALGMRIILVSDPRDIDQAVRLLLEHRPMIVYAVPTHLMYIAARKVGRLPVMFLSGAAPLPEGIFTAIKSDIMMPVSEGYGLTECGPMTHANLSTFSKITGFAAKETLGIGMPVPDTEVKIVDMESEEELGAGEAGEIWIRGPQTMKGYWPAPGSGLTPDGWLRTGDIGKMDAEGYFVLTDRIKDMANVSGYKVYTTEVDEVLYRHPAVAMAAAVGAPDPDRPGSERIKAFIRLKKEFKGRLSAEDVIAFCRERLPSVAVPKYVEFRDELPLTEAQKIFKRALREEEVGKMKDRQMVGEK